MDKEFELTVVMITYNHQNFIEQALKGVLQQKCNFKVELIISNDNSTDDTDKVIRNYLKSIDIPENISINYIKHIKNKGAIPNFRWTLENGQGEYLAICEGDDYWTDPLKLQKQVDFLETNPDYVVCCHNVKIIDEKGILIQDRKLPELIQDRDYSSLELQQGAFLLTPSMVFRNVIREFPSSFAKVLNGDKFLISLLGAYGKGRYIEDIQPAVYRVHSGGTWSHLQKENKLKAKLKTYYYLYLYYKRKNNKVISKYFYYQYNNVLKMLLIRYFKRFQVKSIFTLLLRK